MLKSLAVVSLLLAIPTASALAGEPGDAVRFFYANLGAETQPENRARFTGPALDFLNAADAAWERDETNCIEFGFAVDAQDFDDAEIERTLTLYETIEGTTAKVTAEFYNFGKATQIDWTLENSSNGWLVSDIASAEHGWRVSSMECK